MNNYSLQHAAYIAKKIVLCCIMYIVVHFCSKCLCVMQLKYNKTVLHVEHSRVKNSISLKTLLVCT